MAIVYQHLRNDTNEIFYIGIGKEIKRAYSKNNRSIFWKRIINKYGYTIEIIHQDIDWFYACKLEKFYIKYYGRIDLKTGTLCNLTDGGEGILGYKHSIEHIEKIKLSLIGNKNSLGKKLSLEHIEKIRQAHIGNKNGLGKKLSLEHIEKIRQVHVGKKLSFEHVEKIKQSLIGKKHSPEHIEKLRQAHIGKKHSTDHIEKLRQAHIGKKMSPESIEKTKQAKLKLILESSNGVFYHGVTEAAKAFNLNFRTLGDWLRGTSPNKSNLIYC